MVRPLWLPALVSLSILVPGQTTPLTQAAAVQPSAGGTAVPASVLDFDVFKTRVQPILLAARKGNARCIACHSRGGGNSYLEPLPPGSTAYTDDQSRRNFERVQRLVVPGEPLKSVLLTNPLAEEAGGSHWHGGGKHWRSQDDAEWQVLASWVRTRSTAAAASTATTPGSLSFDVFRTRVQPILLTARKGNARCIACHSRGGGNSYLEPLPPGSAAYNEEQSRRNFERVRRLVVVGQPLKSLLLVNPLSEEAGGSHWHGGGKHWRSQSDPEWQTLAAWVNGAS